MTRRYAEAATWPIKPSTQSKQSVDKLQVVIQKGGKDVKEAEIKRLGVAIEQEIDQAMDQLADQPGRQEKTHLKLS